MSLKDEIENLIKAERDKLETLDQKSREFYERQRQRFIPMRVIIEEISKSVEPEYIRVSIHESDAEIKLGRRNSIGYFEEDIRWQIEPNYEWQPFQNGKEEFGVSCLHYSLTAFTLSIFLEPPAKCGLWNSDCEIVNIEIIQSNLTPLT